MKHKIYLFSLFCLILGLTSCVALNTDLQVRPKDYDLDYWLTEKIDVANMDKSLFYQSKYEGYETYLDSRYDFVKEQEKTKLPEVYATYSVNLEKSMIETIIIKDPTISVYGLSMNSSEASIKKTLLRMGFTYQEYSGRYPSYIKKGFDFTINDSIMILQVIL